MLGHGVEVPAARLPQPHHRPLHGPGQLEEQGPGDDGDIIIIIIITIIIIHSPELSNSLGLLLDLRLHQPSEVVHNVPAIT